MSLLREIQQNTCDPNIRLSDILRKCKILAARLNFKPLDEWVNNELNGYSDDKPLPQYRIFKHIELVGNYRTLNHWGENVGISSFLIPEKYIDKMTTITLNEGIGVVESIVAKSQNSVINISIPQDFLMILKLEVKYLKYFTSISRAISIHQFTNILDTVKNRIVEFAIEIEKINPEAGESILGTNTVDYPMIYQIFNHCILRNYSDDIDTKLNNNISSIKAKSESNLMSEFRKSKYDQSQSSFGNVVDQAHGGSDIRGIGTQHNYAPEQKQTLAEAAAEIQQLLEQLSQTYPTTTTAEKMAVVAEAAEQIEKNPTLKARVINALKLGGTEALKETINHPLVNILMAIFEGWQDAE